MLRQGNEWVLFDTHLNFLELGSAPQTPPANQLKLYAKDKAGVSNLYFKDDAGVEHDLSAGGGGAVTGTGTTNRLAYWTSSTAIGAVGALTSTRIMFADSNGLPVDDAGLTFVSPKLYTGTTAATHTGSNGRFSMDADGVGPIIETNCHASSGQGSWFAHKSRGTHASPSIVSDGDPSLFLLGKGYDGGDYRDMAAIQYVVDGTPGSSDMPGRIQFFTTADGTTSLVARVIIGNDGGIAIQDGITAPATRSGWGTIYIDTSDGDLKIKFGDGTVKTIVTD